MLSCYSVVRRNRLCAALNSLRLVRVCECSGARNMGASCEALFSFVPGTHCCLSQTVKKTEACFLLDDLEELQTREMNGKEGGARCSGFSPA